MANRKGSPRSDTKAIRLRNAILAFVVLLIVVVAGYGVMYASGVDTGAVAEGEHYALIEDAPARAPGEPIVVTEFFSWGCIHCRNFDPLLEDWEQTLPDNVRFERIPVSFSPVFALLAQAYLALEEGGALEANHQRFFRAIHDNNRQFLSADQLADFVDGNGISRAEFLKLFASPAVRRRLSDIEKRSRQARISSVPSLTVADRYRINMNVGRKQALNVADQLIALEQAPDDA
ncbi:MAG: thiol:disulfide interchange protein DsbA/DsbL [Pseudomonadota bacterium]